MTKSIGNILKKARERKRLTMGNVTKNIKIHQKYISALEKDDYSVFSGKVHSKGFLRIYAEYLGLDSKELLALWRREYEPQFTERKEEMFFKKKSVEAPKFVITPGAVFIVFISSCILVFFGYLFYQYKNYTGAPNLDIYYPENNLVLETDILDITGKTDLDSELYINNQRVILGPDGSFVESVKLKEGLNTISIKSVNKLSQQTEYVRTIIYRPDEKEKAEDAGRGKNNGETQEATSSPETSEDEKTTPGLFDEEAEN